MIYSIVLIRYPFYDLIDYKIRPVLVPFYPITKFNHLVTAFITSKIPEALEKSEVVIFTDKSIIKSTGLKQNSAIRLHRLFTIPQDSILKYLSELPSSFHSNIKDKLKIIFNISD